MNLNRFLSKINQVTDKPRILLVDDDRTNINMLGNMLQQNYEIMVALDGEQALKQANSGLPIDLILLDIQLPGIDGFEVCQKFKANEEFKEIPVIFITANTNLDAERIGLLMGAVDYITKPFNKNIVELRVKNQLELKRQRDLLARLSKFDGLTGVFNRQYFDEFLAAEWARSFRDKTPLSLIMIDIDCFKDFNDSYGHIAGDECLKKVAVTIEESLERPVDFTARYGGEEFVCVLPNTNADGAHYMAELIRQNIIDLNIPHQQSEDISVVSISLGVNSMVADNGNSPLTFLNTADQRLYQAKKNGRNQVVSVLL